MPKSQLINLISEATERGANAALSALGVLKPYLSKQECYDKYGRGNVDRWIREGLITPRKDGPGSAKWRIDRSEIDIVAKISNRPSYNQITCK